MTTKAPPTLPVARARRAEAQALADELFETETRLRAQVSRAVVPGSTDVARAVALKTELRKTELAIETVVQGFAALDQDVRAAETRFRRGAATDQLTPLLAALRTAGQEFDVAFTRFQAAKQRLEFLIPQLSPVGRDAGLATSTETVKALELLVRDVLRRKLQNEGNPVYERFAPNAEPLLDLMATEAEAT